jgi:hypothetical protein
MFRGIQTALFGFYKSGTLFKKPKRDAGAQHVGAGKFRHPHTVGRATQSTVQYVDDGFFRSTYVDFPLPACCAPASRLAFLTVIVHFIEGSKYMFLMKFAWFACIDIQHCTKKF